MKEYIEKAVALEALSKSGVTCNMRAHKIVASIQAADVVEVRHGRWIEDERTYPGPGLKNNLCSACGEVAGAWKEGLEPGRKWAYCPNCGAKMDRKEDGHEAD